jgi:hypothetical protein
MRVGGWTSDYRYALLTEKERAKLSEAQRERFRWLSQKKDMDGLSLDETKEAQNLWLKATR